MQSLWRKNACFFALINSFELYLFRRSSNFELRSSKFEVRSSSAGHCFLTENLFISLPQISRISRITHRKLACAIRLQTLGRADKRGRSDAQSVRFVRSVWKSIICAWRFWRVCPGYQPGNTHYNFINHYNLFLSDNQNFVSRRSHESHEEHLLRSC